MVDSNVNAPININHDLNILSNTDNNITTLSDSVKDISKWLVNLTDTELPQNVLNVLQLGEKFCSPTPDRGIPYVQIIANIEGALLDSTDENVDKSRLRNEIVNILTNFKTRSRHKKRLTTIELKMLKDVSFTKHFIKQHPEILITRADKGNTTVIIDKSDYFNKIQIMLNDTATYKLISKDNTNAIQRKLNLMVSSWFKDKKINEYDAKILKSNHGVVAKLYGLPKIHKPDVPYRPIVSSIGTPLYHLSAFLSNILNKTVGKSFSAIKNSFEFKTKIKNLVLPINHTILSLDVTSLFTNVDSRLVLELINQNWKDIKSNSSTMLNKSQFIDAMELVLSNCEFTFNKNTFKQLFGSPMGSPTSPAVADLVMEFIESNVLASLNFKPIFYFRYVDDIVTAIPTNKIDYFFDKFNSFNDNIKFTIELEANNKLAFLDLLLIHNADGTISTDWFHKQTWSGRYLNFHSHLPIAYKRNTVKLLANKIILLSDPIFHNENFRLLKHTLLNNGYPNSFFRPIINTVIFKNSSTNNQSVEIIQQTDNSINKFIAIPYVKTLHENIQHCLKKFKYKVVGRANNNLGKTIFSSLKDLVPLGYKKDVVYEVKCECDQVYIGQTTQLLNTRFCQHKRDAVKLNKNKVCREATSSLSAHLNEFNHSVFLENVKILEHEANHRTRRVLEMVHIKKCQLKLNCLNKQSDCVYLQDTYNNIIS